MPTVRIFDASRNAEVTVDQVRKSVEEWKHSLTPKQYEITTKSGTEAPGSKTWADIHEDGIFRCVRCHTDLFRSRTKFESGTGWPSFYEPISRLNVVEHPDDSLGMRRTEVLCARCGSHLGHVFDDGPKPTGKRYCMNGYALEFVPAEALKQAGTETATLAGGCFWCLEAVFKELEGVTSVMPGYAGGTTPDPTYEQVSTGKTGHAEAVQLAYDPSKLSFRKILDVFFSVHDPTSVDRQGADVGNQYRSAIFYHSIEQKAEADKMIAELTNARTWRDPIVTQVVPLDRFYPAEEHHRNYFAKHPGQGYCQAVVAPKVEKFREKFSGRTSV